MITNKQRLLHPSTCISARKLILGALEAALSAVDARVLMMNNVKLKGRTLYVMETKHSLDDFNSIHVVGAGKASGHMAEALYGILNDRIANGFVIIPENLKAKLRTGRIRLWKAGHPIPDQRGVEGARQMLVTLDGVGKDDLVICLISGGGSALMPLPYGDITISDKQMVTYDLLRSGATIREINAVRKHLSAIKGGRLAERLQKAHMVSLIISDVVGNRLDSIASGPTVPDGTTFSDVARILKKYGLWESLNEKVKRVIEKGMAGSIPETPKRGSSIFRNVRNFVIGSNKDACLAALNYLTKGSIDAKIMKTPMEGEARKVGKSVASLAAEMRAMKHSSAVIMGGETTVTVRGSGRGGRNQEAVLAASLGISKLDNMALVSIGTDGIDGNSDAAGAIADSFTIKRAMQLNLVPSKFLRNNDSNSFFKRLSDTIQTGPTGTNVNDVLILLCL